MNFPFDASKNQAASTPASNATATGATPNFTFGASGAGDAGKTLGTGFPLMSTPSQSKAGGLFSSGLSTTPAQPTGFTFGATTSASAPVQGTPATSTQATGLSFGTPATTNANITFASTPATSVNFAAATSNAPASAGLAFGTPKPTAGAVPHSAAAQTTPSSGTSGLSFGSANIATSSTGFNVGGASSIAAPATTTATTTSAGGFSLGSVPATTTGSGLSLGGFSLGTGASTPATSGFSLGGPTTVTTATGFSVGKAVSATVAAAAAAAPPPPTSLATATTQASLGTTTTVTSSNAAQLGAINFCQLEESINKWTLELEEQEKAFVNQAAQVNAWDKLLITNGEKIVTLNQEVERVKLEQQQLEHELDYVVGQQKELQDCLVPLEKELASLSVSDPEREYTYRLAENLDTQLKQMSEDLKEIIEHLNEANRTQDSSDPIVQIGKILNAHMNSLQWLDQRTTLLAQKIQQIDQMHQNFRQENERNFSLAYN